MLYVSGSADGDYWTGSLQEMQRYNQLSQINYCGLMRMTVIFCVKPGLTLRSDHRLKVVFSKNDPSPTT